MKFINYPIIQFSVAYVLGICLVHFGLVQFPIPFFSLLLFPFILFILWFVYKKKLQNSRLFGVFTLLFFFLLGILNYHNNTPASVNNHYSHHYLDKEASKILLEIVSIVKPSGYYNKYVASVITVDSASTRGKVLLLVAKEDQKTPLEIDDKMLVYSSIQAVDDPLNPYQFDYKAYLKNQEIYGEVKIEETDILYYQHSTSSLQGWASKARNYIINKLEKTSLHASERSIIQALLLGDRKDVDKELYADYAAAGAVHILAVSGLHVGVLYFLLSGLLTPLKRIRYGKYAQPIFVVILLWGFAFITGLSPSVTRAVTMFSFFGLAQLLHKRTSTVNTLALSFLLLLLIKPLWLFHVGFQLSYLAVFFIVWTVPLLSKMYSPTTTVGGRLWDIVYVSLAAQLGVFPLSLYYFHQFPGLFLASNLLILPLLGLLLGSGVFILLLLALDLLPDIILEWYGTAISLLNETIQFIAGQDTFLIKDISFTVASVFVSYFIIIATIRLLKKRSANRILWLLGSVLLFVCVSGFEKIRDTSNELLIFHKTKETLIAEKSGANISLVLSDTLSHAHNTYPLQSYLLNSGSTLLEKKKLPSYFTFGQQSFIVIDSTGVFPQHIKAASVLLTQSPKIHLEKVIDSLQPSLIIADGSNYRSYVERWKHTCVTKKIPFHDTGEKGAFVLVFE